MAAVSTFVAVGAALAAGLYTEDKSNKAQAKSDSMMREQASAKNKLDKDLMDKQADEKAKEKEKKNLVEAIYKQKAGSAAGREGTVLGSQALGSSSSPSATKTLLGE